MKFDSYTCVNKLLSLSPRQGKNVIRAANYITDVLKSYDVSYQVETFKLSYPKTLSASLIVDGKSIPCKSSTWESGKITNKDNILSSLTKSTKKYKNINFNPYSKHISLATCSEKTSITVAPKYLPAILRSTGLVGSVKVKKITESCVNILVGNLHVPKYVIFTHFDSIGTGAIDNASGTAVSLECILNSQDILRRSLFVLSGNEELSYDQPIYWGHGYREFEYNHSNLLKNAKHIIIVDCVGHSKTKVYNDKYWVEEAFPIKMLEAVLHKTTLLAGDLYKLMSVYHSEYDTIQNIRRIHLSEAAKKIRSIIE